MGTELDNYDDYTKALARLIEYVEAFERVWNFAPTRELENVFSDESSPEEQETIIAQLTSDAVALDEATAEGRDLGDEIYWLNND